MSATAKNEMQPAIYRFTFGNLEIINILDGKVIRNGLHPALGRSAARMKRAIFVAPITSIPTAMSIRSFRP